MCLQTHIKSQITQKAGKDCILIAILQCQAWRRQLAHQKNNYEVSFLGISKNLEKSMCEVLLRQPGEKRR